MNYKKLAKVMDATEFMDDWESVRFPTQEGLLELRDFVEFMRDNYNAKFVDEDAKTESVIYDEEDLSPEAIKELQDAGLNITKGKGKVIIKGQRMANDDYFKKCKDIVDKVSKISSSDIVEVKQYNPERDYPWVADVYCKKGTTRRVKSLIDRVIPDDFVAITSAASNYTRNLPTVLIRRKDPEYEY